MRTLKSSCRLLLLTAAVSLGGCATAPPAAVPQPELDIPQQWASPADVSGEVASGWVDRFGDAELEALVDEALVRNHDLRIAVAQLDAAEAAARKAAAAFVPAVDLGVTTQRSDGPDSGTTAQPNIGVSLDIAWEVDLWGRVRSGASAAQAQADAAARDLAFARLSLVAQTAKAWFVAIETALQRRLAEENVADLDETLRIVSVRLREGLVSRQDERLAKTDLAVAQEQREAAITAQLEARRSLELLLGRYPQAELRVRRSLPALPQLPAAGLPAELLERRPDLRAAETRIAAAFSVAEQARAARLPRINLTSSLGTASDALRNLSDPVNTFWQVGLNLLQPLIDGGRLQADVDIADARQQEAVALYARQALTAFAEVERALTAAGSLRRRVASLRDAVHQAEESHRLASLRYREGDSELLDVLQIHRRLLESRKALLRVELQQLLERVNLHLALGGDF